MELHFSARRIRAGTRGGALAVSGYITGRASIDGIRINNPHKPNEIAFTSLALPPGSALRSGVELWRAADIAERKRDGEYRRHGGHAPILASHADLALPYGISEAQAREVVSQICQHLVEKHGVGVEVAAHNRNGKLDHVHFLWSTRTVGPTGIGPKARSLNAIAQRQNGSTGPCALEEIREIASKAIRDSCGVEWDHRSFKRRGIDKVPEPKLDQRQLREQRRRLRKSGTIAPTQVERDLKLFREARANISKPTLAPEQGIRRLPYKSVLEAALEMENYWTSEISNSATVQQAINNGEKPEGTDVKKPKPKPSEDDDNWGSNLLELHPGHKIEEHKIQGVKPWQWLAQIDKPDFNENAVIDKSPFGEHEEDFDVICTALYADSNRLYSLRDRAALLLAMRYKKTLSYVIWILRCYKTYLHKEGILEKIFPSTPHSEAELRKEMLATSHARLKPEHGRSGNNVTLGRPIPKRNGTGMLD